MYIINWKNSYTGDTGYVAHVNYPPPKGSGLLLNGSPD